MLESTAKRTIRKEYVFFCPPDLPGMRPFEEQKEELLGRIDGLLEEAYTLPKSSDSWERRLYIDWELFLLFRRLADLFEAHRPDLDEELPGKNTQAHRRRRRRDRPPRTPVRYSP